jgi:hypothetical protein
MAAKLLNTFLLGADPELVLLNPPKLINGQQFRRAAPGVYGFDHGGFVVEPHPTPDFSARTVCANIKKSLDVLSKHFPDYKLRAGAYYHDPDTRHVTLGGHIHLDLTTLAAPQIRAMDVFCESLEDLDILPSQESKQRFERGDYGRKGDVRGEHGHVEYRSMCSWLFSRKTSMLCLTGIKLAALQPETIAKMTSIQALNKWFERFKGADDDVDWILDRGYFDTSLEAKPDANVKAVWKVDPDKAEEWEAEIKATIPANVVNLAGLLRRVQAGERATAQEAAEVRRRATEGSESARQVLRAIQAAILTQGVPVFRDILRNNHF